MIGYRDSDTTVFGLDFSQVYTDTCDLQTDYELWWPSDDADHRACLMGHNVTYQRRIPTRECFNPQQFDAIMSVVDCPCTEEDWECDMQYHRVSDSYTCEVDSGVNQTYPPSNCINGSTYYKTKGYRREAGNTCSGGVDHSAEGPFDCPSNNTNKSKAWIAAVVVVPWVIIGLVVAAVALRSQKVREKLPFLKFLNTWKVGYMGVQGGGSTMLEIDEEEGGLKDDKDDHKEELLDLEDKKEKEEKDKDDDFNPRG